MSPNQDIAIDLDRLLVKTILAKFGRDDRNSNHSLAKLSFQELFAKLSPEEVALVKILLDISPPRLGFLGPFITMDEPPDNLVEITGQRYCREGKEIAIGTRHLPGSVWQAFSKMQSALNRDLGSSLMIESGYRSPAHQAIVFLTYLELFNFDLKYVASGVALPGYSQHGDPINTAIDVINQDGVPTDQEPELFANTEEYRWLTINAARFGFVLSYPKDNEWGVKFEPWHWQFNPRLAKSL